jgi:putative CocE/NonD family hydrolase
MRRGLPEPERLSLLKRMLAEHDVLDEDGYLDLPIGRWPARHDPRLPDLGALSLRDEPSVSSRSRVEGHHNRVEVPSLNIGGWYDVALGGTIVNFETMASLGIESRLLIGPWSHRAFADPIGELFFGVSANRFMLSGEYGGVADLPLSWLRSKLDPELELELPEKPVQFFLMGRNEWREAECWPPPGTRIERQFLQADGGLGREPDRPGANLSFIHDPADPVPTIGGQTVMNGRHPDGPRDQRGIEGRPDVLVFTSGPLEHELAVVGPVRVVLHGESSAISADWVARLCDVHPDGRSVNLCDGILRVDQGADSSGAHEIDLWSTANVFLPGHRLRVHVAASSFPRWERNLGDGEQAATQMNRARQTISLDAGHPSYIELSAL